MKNIACVTILIFLLLMSISVASGQWDDCPAGLHDDAYPGQCGSYIDTNNDGICDRSQENPDAARSVEDAATQGGISSHGILAKTVQEAADMFGIDAAAYAASLGKAIGAYVDAGTSLQALHDDLGLCGTVAKEIALSLQAQVPDARVENPSGNPGIFFAGRERIYHSVPITLILILLYMAGEMLVRRKKLAASATKKFWNILLLVSFLVSGLLGILLVIRLEYGLMLSLPFNMLYWHVEAGIVMTVISLFHIFWHLRYFLAIVKVRP